MTQQVPWPRAILNLTFMAIIVLGIMFGIVYFIAPSMIPGTDAYSERIARETTVAAQREAESKRQIELIKAEAACHKAVRARSKFPTKAVFDQGIFNLPQMGKLKNDPSTIGIRGRVELMNAFGAMIPHRYACDVKNERVVRISVEPG